MLRWHRFLPTRCSQRIDGRKPAMIYGSFKSVPTSFQLSRSEAGFVFVGRPFL